MKKIERILVVDDDPDIAKLLHSKLSKLGYQVQVHSRAKDAVHVANAMNAQHPLMDVMLGM